MSRQEESVMMECYTVGDIYQKAVNHQEGLVFDMDDSGINLSVYMRKPTTHEIEQFASGKAFEMKLVQLKNIIFTIVKFGDMGWMDAPYTVHLSRNLTKLEVPAKIDNARQFIDDMKEAATVIYTDGGEGMRQDEILNIIEKHKVQGTCADDSPMNDNKSNAVTFSVILAVGLVILLAVSLFLFPRLFIPIIVIAVVLEAVNNIIPQKK